MAKRHRNQTRREAGAVNLTVQTILEKLSAPVQRQVQGMRERFSAYGAQFKAAWQSREELCEPFFKLFGAVQADTTCSFVQFVGLMDPDVPVDQRDDVTEGGRIVKGYRSHPSYQAALYMQRLQQQRARAKTQAANPQARVRNLNATQRLARVLATMIPLIRESEVERFWSGIGTELDLDTAGLNRLRKQVGEAEPILRVPELRANQRIPVRIVHMVRPGEAEQPQRARRAA